MLQKVDYVDLMVFWPSKVDAAV